MKKAQDILAANVSRWMDDLKYSQADYAEVADIAQRTVSNVVRYGSTNVTKLDGIASGLRVPTYSLFMPALKSRSEIDRLDRLIQYFRRLGELDQKNLLLQAERGPIRGRKAS